MLILAGIALVYGIVIFLLGWSMRPRNLNVLGSGLLGLVAAVLIGAFGTPSRDYPHGNKEVATVGIVLLAAAVLWLVVCLVGSYRKDKREKEKQRAAELAKQKQEEQAALAAAEAAKKQAEAAAKKKAEAAKKQAEAAAKKPASTSNEQQKQTGAKKPASASNGQQKQTGAKKPASTSSGQQKQTGAKKPPETAAKKPASTSSGQQKKPAEAEKPAATNWSYDKNTMGKHAHYRFFVKFRRTSQLQSFLKNVVIEATNGKEYSLKKIADVCNPFIPTMTTDSTEDESLMGPIGNIFTAVTVEEDEAFVYIQDERKSFDFFRRLTDYLFGEVRKVTANDVILIADLTDFNTDSAGDSIQYYLGNGLKKCHVPGPEGLEHHEIELSNFDEMLQYETLSQEERRKIDEILGDTYPVRLVDDRMTASALYGATHAPRKKHK